MVSIDYSRLQVDSMAQDGYGFYSHVALFHFHELLQ